MATTERTNEHAPVDEIAASIRNASLVCLVGAPRGDALAGVGLLARALETVDVPFQASLTFDVNPGGSEADLTIGVSHSDSVATHTIKPDEVHGVAAALGHPDPVLGMVTAAARVGADTTPGGLTRRPGLGVPTADPGTGLAHSTIVHGSFSGDPERARAVLGADAEGTDESARRSRASAVVLSVAAESPPGSRAGTAVEGVLRPHVGGPLETVEGYADVLDALARHDPGIGLAMVIGKFDVEAALSIWRSHAEVVHTAVAEAELRRYDGVAVVDVDVGGTSVEPIARLLRDFRSPEPAVLVIGPDRTALASGAGRDARRLLRDHGPVVGHDGVASIPSGSTDLEPAILAGMEDDT